VIVGNALKSLYGHPAPLLHELSTDTISNKAKTLAINFVVLVLIKIVIRL